MTSLSKEPYARLVSGVLGANLDCHPLPFLSLVYAVTAIWPLSLSWEISLFPSALTGNGDKEINDIPSAKVRRQARRRRQKEAKERTGGRVRGWTLDDSPY